MFTLQKLFDSIKMVLSKAAAFLLPLCCLADTTHPASAVPDDLEQGTFDLPCSATAGETVEMKNQGGKVIDVADKVGEGLAKGSDMPGSDAEIQVSANEPVHKACSGDHDDADEMTKVIEVVQDNADEATSVVDHAFVLDNSADAEVDVFESSPVPSILILTDEDVSYTSSLADSPLPLTPALPASLLFDQCDSFPLCFDITDFEESRATITACPSVLFASAGDNDFYSFGVVEDSVPALDKAWLHRPEALMDIFEDDLSEELDEEDSLRMPDSPTLSPCRVRIRSSPTVATSPASTDDQMPGSFVKEDDEYEEDCSFGDEDSVDATSGIKGFAITWLSSVHAWVSHARREETMARWPDLERGM